VVFSPLLATGTLEINTKGIDGPLSAAITNKDGQILAHFLNLSKNGTRIPRLTTSFSFIPAKFMGLMAAGKAFFNVYTRKHPMGEVRGALVSLAPSRGYFTDIAWGPYRTPVMNDQHFLDSVIRPPHPRLFDTFHLRRAALGSEFKSMKDSGCTDYLWRTDTGFTGCIPTGSPAQITPIVRICVRSGAFLDAISFIFQNGEQFSYGGNGGSEHCLEIAEGVRITELTFGSGDWMDTLNIKLSDGKTLTSGSGSNTQMPYVAATDDNVKRAKAIMDSGPGCMEGGKCPKTVPILDTTVGSGILCGFHVRGCEKPDRTGSYIYTRTDKLITHVALYFSPPIHKTDPFNITHDMEQVPSMKNIQKSQTSIVAGTNLRDYDSKTSAFAFTNLCPQGNVNVGTQKLTQQMGESVAIITSRLAIE